MNKKMSKRQRNIKTKLMAAICMLLVSSIMMVSTTYAWFTLSTAPEVTGIQTAVGANGNLEMALMNPNLQEDDGLKANWGDLITSGTSDSMDAAGRLTKEANITWGNLVDVSDPVTYGLNNITLYPSALALNDDGTLGARPLSRPVYGADGRIAELKADTMTASYVSGKFANENALGVRAVGTASTMTAREMAHRTALDAASTAIKQAKGKAATTLGQNGHGLAAIAIDHMADNKAKVEKSDLQNLTPVLVDLAAAHGYIETAMKQYVIAFNIAPNTVTDSTYQAIQTEIGGMSLATIDAWAADYKYKLPTGFNTAYDKLVESQGLVTDAQTDLAELLKGDGPYEWGAVSGILNTIMNFSEMKICDLDMDTATAKNDAGEYINIATIANAMTSGGLKLQMPSGSGVFANIADFCGEYSSSITFQSGNVMGYPLTGVKATMTCDDPINPTYLDGIRSYAKVFQDTAGADATKSITDFYGYIIDLAFRTNAGDSSLKLQQTAIDRIYGTDGKNEEVMGHGATMTFTASDSFGVTKVEDLMGSIRVVFFDPDTKEIIGYARLDPSTSDMEGNNVTMNLAMCDAAGAWAANQEIVELEQNKAKAVSVLVYLDGNTVKNEDVATTGSQSMTGTMNLQFSSTATLDPMDYADLKEGKDETAAAETITLTKIKTDDATSALDYSIVKAEAGTYGTKTGFVVVMNKTAGTNDVVKAKIGTDEITGQYFVLKGVPAYVFEYSGTLTAETEISISVTAGAATPTATTLTAVTVTGDATATGSFTGSAVTITLTANTGKQIDSVGAVTVGGTTLETSAYTYSNGTLTFTSEGIAADTAVAITVATSDVTP